MAAENSKRKATANAADVTEGGSGADSGGSVGPALKAAAAAKAAAKAETKAKAGAGICARTRDGDKTPSTGLVNTAGRQDRERDYAVSQAAAVANATESSVATTKEGKKEKKGKKGKSKLQRKDTATMLV